MSSVRTYKTFESRVLLASGTSIPYASGNVTKSLVTKTDTVKRPFPADPFASGTARVVSSTLFADSPGFRFQSSSYGSGDWIVGDVLSRYFDWSTTLLIGDSVDNSFLLNRIRNKVRGDSVNLAQALAEYRQTASLFGDTVLRVAKLAKAAVRKDVRILRPRTSWSKTTSNAWLEFQYGIKPLVSDVDGALLALQQRVAVRPIYLTGTVRHRTERRLSSVRTIAGPFRFYPTTGRYEELSDITFRAQYRVKLNSNWLASTLSQYGVLNIPALAYELTPFSFVLDWFVNVGDILQSLDNLIMFDEALVIYSASQGYRGFISCDNSWFLGSAHMSVMKTVRSAPSTFSLIVRPEFKPSIVAIHVANGVALLNQTGATSRSRR